MGGNGKKSGDPLRGALLGFGNVALHAHLPVWQQSKNVKIDAVVEPLPERRELIKTLIPDARIYADLDLLLEEGDVDFVDICTPSSLHGELMLRACRSGLHVFCEKPLFTSSGLLRQIEETANRLHRALFVVNNWKYAPLWSRTLELIREGRIGTVRSVCLSVLRTPNSGGGISNWRQCAQFAGGGILLDHGWHNLYLILSMMKERPLSLSAHMQYPQPEASGLEDTVDLAIHFPGAEARLHLTWRAGCRRNHGTIIGDLGRLSMDDDHLILEPGNGAPPVRYDFPEPLSKGSHHPQWMAQVVECFRREVADDKARGANFLEGKWCAHLIDLAYRSQLSGSCLLEVGDLLSEG
jgi:predicted dehydrogenase